MDLYLYLIKKEISDLYKKMSKEWDNISSGIEESLKNEERIIKLEGELAVKEKTIQEAREILEFYSSSDSGQRARDFLQKIKK